MTGGVGRVHRAGLEGEEVLATVAVVVETVINSSPTQLYGQAVITY